jgi:HSP20 family molecular chaperone IbpA
MSKDIAKQDTRLAETLDERPAVAPAVDIYENADEYLIVADVPGVKNDAVKLHFEEGQLTLRAARSDRFDYRRAFYLPEGVDIGKADAKLANGALSIHLPKSAEAKPRRIPVT